MVDYRINNIYQGGYSSLKPDYGDIFTGYRTSAGSLGLTTDPRSANILQEASSKLRTGVKQIEISAVSPEIFESIPNQQLKEVNRLSKLTGVDISVHAPIIEASGISNQGFSESSRESAERQMMSAVERSHEINPDGSSPVTFHSSAVLPAPEIVKTKEGKEIGKMIVINQETNEIRAVKKEDKIYPGEGKVTRNVEQELDTLNNSEWINGITNLEFYKKEADEVISKALIPLVPILEKQEKGEKIEFTQKQKIAFEQMQKADVFLNNVEAAFNTIYNKAYKYSDDKSRKELDRISESWIKSSEKMKEKATKLNLPLLKSKQLDEALGNIRKITAPEVYKPLTEFAQDKTAQTFANIAFDSYKKFTDKAPIISIENPPAGTAFSTGKELKKIVEESRKKFVERAVKEGMPESQAKFQAERLIGVTWDVGHINMLRKQGYEEKDIVKETEKVAPLVKHIHLSDNFGFEHTELPMGMGNVPVKEIMEKLGKKGFEAKKIIEAGNWWQHFKNPPVKETLEAMGSPIYSMQMQPYWNQSLGFQQGYFGGYGQMLPQVNYETFGAGFSQLSTELGGQRPGAQGSRMSNRPME